MLTGRGGSKPRGLNEQTGRSREEGKSERCKRQREIKTRSKGEKNGKKREVSGGDAD